MPLDDGGKELLQIPQGHSTPSFEQGVGFYRRMLNVIPPGASSAKIKMPLWVIVRVNTLTKIDPIAGSFDVSLLIMFFWVASDFDNLGAEVIGKASDSGGWLQIPVDEMKSKVSFPTGLTVYNKLSGSEGSYFDEAAIVDVGKRLLYTQMRGSWAVEETQDLKDFPYDHQELTLNLRMVDISADAFDMTVHMAEFSEASLEHAQYTLHPPKFERIGSPSVNTKLHLMIFRKPKFYIESVVLFVFSFTVMGLGVFAIEADLVAERLAHVLTAVLTTVAYSLAMRSFLPPLSYKTSLDVYIHTSFGLLFSLFCYVTLVSLTKDALEDIFGYDVRPDLDFWVSTSFLVLIILMTVVWGCLSWSKRQEEVRQRGDELRWDKTRGGLCLSIANPDSTFDQDVLAKP